jgi:hypothetical protein
MIISMCLGIDESSVGAKGVPEIAESVEIDYV